MAQLLTSKNFTRESFRHSQGNSIPQVTLFGIFAKEHGILPILDPTQDMTQDYARLLTSSSIRTHLQYSKQLDAPSEEVEKTFSDLKMLSETIVLPKKTATMHRLLLRQILDREIELLTVYVPEPLATESRRASAWPRPDKIAAGLRVRMQHRIAGGRTSFIHHYGLEGHTTHFTEFDSLYATLAGLYRKGLSKNGKSPERKHQELVDQAVAYAAEVK